MVQNGISAAFVWSMKDNELDGNCDNDEEEKEMDER